MKKKLPLAALAMAGILGASVWFQPLAPMRLYGKSQEADMRCRMERPSEEY